MKALITLLLTVFFSISLYAQPIARPRMLTSHNRVVNTLLQLQGSSRPAHKSTSGIPTERVKAQSTRDNSISALNDSVDLKYSTNMGSVYDYNTMIYPYNYPYNASPLFDFAGVFTHPQVLFDTFRHWAVDPNTLTYGYYETGLAGYDTGRNLTNYMALTIDSSFYPNMIYANTFGAAHNITGGFSSNWVLGVADSAFKQYFTYDISNKIIKDSMYELHLGTWRLVAKSFYTYDLSGNLIQIDNYANTTDTSFLLPLVKQIKYVNTYDGSNRLLTVLDSTFDGTALAQNQKDTFAYTGAYTFHTSWKQYQWDAINAYWAPMFYMTKHLNGSGQPDTVNINGFDSLANAWVPHTMDLVHYNATGNPDTLRDFEYNFTAFPSTPDFTTVYYYETYLVTLGLHGATAAAQATVFPNPANNTITIAGPGLADNIPVTIIFTNMAGQAIKTETRPWHNNLSLSVGELPPATYMLIMHDGSGNLLHRQTIVKE